MGTVDCGIAIRPLNRYLSECGDTGKAYVNDEYCCLTLVDVLGHGREAHTVAVQAETYLDAHYTEDPVHLLQGLHTHLAGTRGAVASICRLRLATGALDYAGIGNISVKIIGSRSERLVSRDGVIGYRTISPRAVETSIKPGDIVLMHSDGIRSSINFLQITDLLLKSAGEIADAILKTYGTKRDDASCIVMKYQL